MGFRNLKLRILILFGLALASCVSARPAANTPQQEQERSPSGTPSRQISGGPAKNQDVLQSNCGGDFDTYHSWATGYVPFGDRMQGGVDDRKGRPLQTLQDYLSGQADYVSVAMDSHIFKYGQTIHIPELEEKYKQKIIFKVVDTGGRFKNRGTDKVDICVGPASHASEIPEESMKNAHAVTGHVTIVVCSDERK